MIWIFIWVNYFLKSLFSSQFSLKYLTVSWHFSTLTGSLCLFHIKPVHWVRGAGIGPAQGPCCFFLVFFVSRPFSFPVTQSYLISWTATREQDPGVLMLIRAVGRLLAGLEEPERRQETRSNTVTENVLQHDGDEMWNCIWSDFEICWMSRGILITGETKLAFWPGLQI